MTMTRRDFGRRAFTGCAVLAISPSLLLLEGCTISKAQLQSYGDTIDMAIANILTATGQQAWADKVKQAQAVFDNAVQNWNGASTSAAVVSALNALETILPLIPVANVYAPLIDVIIAAAETIIASLPFNKTSVQAKQAHMPRKTTTPHFRSVQSFADAWNRTVAANPDLKVAPLQVVN